MKRQNKDAAKDQAVSEQDKNKNQQNDNLLHSIIKEIKETQLPDSESFTVSIIQTIVLTISVVIILLFLGSIYGAIMKFIFKL